MKIAYHGLELPEGKTRYDDPIVTALAEKFQPAKVSPYYVEFLPDEFEQAEAIVVASDKLLDLLILDMEKLEGRIERSADAAEQKVAARALALLEAETPLCGAELSAEEEKALRALGMLSLKPTLVVQDSEASANSIIETALAKAGRMFFYTAGKKEVHAWLVEAGSDALTCAGRIHSDLARGFIKAEVVSFEELMSTHSMQSARSEGLVRLVDRDAVIPPRSVIEIRFNV